MKRIVRVWFLILVVLTVISVALTILHTIDYGGWREERIQKLISDWGFTREFIEAYVDCQFIPPRWHEYGIGPLVIFLDIATACMIVSTIIVDGIKKRVSQRGFRVLVLAFLIISAAYATLYTVAAHDLASWGWTCRGTLGDATFLPFPTGPRGAHIYVVAKKSPFDAFIHAYLIETGALIAISIFLGILAAAYLLKAVLPLFACKKSK